MSDGDPFRGDREAQAARTDALEHEVDRLERERDELKTKLAAAEAGARNDKQRSRRQARKELARENARGAKDKARARSESDSEATSGRTALVAIGLGVVVVAVAVAVPMCRHKRTHARWVADTDAYARDTTRWDAYTQIGACLRRTRAAIAASAKLSAATMDPRAAGGESRSISSAAIPDACAGELGTLAADPTLPQGAREVARAWVTALTAANGANREIEEYYNHSDWKDDDYASGPLKWDSWQAARARVDAATREASTTLMPPIAQAIATIEAAQVQGSDVWWKIEIGARLEAMAAASVAESPTAVAALATQLLADAKTAPLEIRRLVRETSDLEELAARGALSGTSAAIDQQNYRFWGALQRDQAPFVSPGDEPEGACDGDGGGA